MRVKLRYTLPEVQMALAIGAFWWSDRWFRVQMRLQDMPGPAPAFTLLMALNAPLALLRAFYYRFLPEFWYRVAFVATIGLFWQWVGANIESWRRNREVLTFHRAPLRILADLVLIALGILCGIWFAGEWREVGPLSWPSLPWILGFVGPLVTWSLALTLFFGRDFIHCARRRKRT